MRYLAATDGSDESDRAVQYASTQAVAFDATIEIVHALEFEAKLIDGEIVLPGGDKSTKLGNQTLEQARELAVRVVEEADSDVAVDTRLLTGRPADAITDRARETGADAIYVGHRGRSEEPEQAVGSVAKSVVDKATVPVTVIR